MMIRYFILCFSLFTLLVHIFSYYTLAYCIINDTLRTFGLVHLYTSLFFSFLIPVLNSSVLMSNITVVNKTL